jgi:hypothetical protein
MEVAHSKTVYVDEDREAEVPKAQILYGMELGAVVGDDDRPTGEIGTAGPTREVHQGNRVCDHSSVYQSAMFLSDRHLGLLHH